MLGQKQAIQSKYAFVFMLNITLCLKKIRKKVQLNEPQHEKKKKKKKKKKKSKFGALGEADIIAII